MTYTFKRDRSSEIILEAMKMTQADMKEKGLWNDNTTFEDWANYAGSHVLITEKPKQDQ